MTFGRMQGFRSQPEQIPVMLSKVKSNVYKQLGRIAKALDRIEQRTVEQNLQAREFERQSRALLQKHEANLPRYASATKELALAVDRAAAQVIRCKEAAAVGSRKKADGVGAASSHERYAAQVQSSTR